MSCGNSINGNKTCAVWMENFKNITTDFINTNQTEAQLNLERQINLFSNDSYQSKNELCLDENTGLYRKPKDEFCKVTSELQKNGKIVDKKTNQILDSFCKKP